MAHGSVFASAQTGRPAGFPAVGCWRSPACQPVDRSADRPATAGSPPAPAAGHARGTFPGQKRYHLRARGGRTDVTGRQVVRLLIVEDDPEMLEILQRGFREEHYEVVCASDANEALMAAAIETYAVILLDVMLPGDSDGFGVCRELRERGNLAPILMLTARDAIEDRVHGLEVGADDYLVKPFAFRELLARVRALARRQPDLLPDIHMHADLRVDLRKRIVQRGDHEISLTAKEFELLEFFVRNADQVMQRAAITAWVWDDNHDPFANALEVLIRRLRAKIDDDYTPQLIHTVRGAGYRFGV